MLLPIVIAVLLLLGFTAFSSQAQATSLLQSGDSMAPSQNYRNDSGIQMHKSDGRLTGSEITSDSATWPGSDKVWNICAAVAIAEGFNNGVGAAPYDLNNPGDLSPGDESGQATCGGAQFHGGSAVILFCTAEDGWTALYRKFNNIITGRSRVYSATATWQQIAQKYAGNWQNWLTNVTNYLGVDASSTPSDYVNS